MQCLAGTFNATAMASICFLIANSKPWPPFAILTLVEIVDYVDDERHSRADESALAVVFRDLIQSLSIRPAPAPSLAELFVVGTIESSATDFRRE